MGHVRGEHSRSPTAPDSASSAARRSQIAVGRVRASSTPERLVGNTGREDRRTVRVRAEAGARAPDLVDHDQVHVLGDELRLPARLRSSVSAANPTSTRPSFEAPSSARMSGVGRTASVAALGLLELRRGGDLGPEVGDGGGHDDRVRLARRLDGRVAHLLGRLDPDDRGPSGGGDGRGSDDQGTSAPRANASSATASPLPVERLPRNRTGSIGSCVGPAVTTTRRPARSRPSVSRSSAAARISSGSAMRPGPRRRARADRRRAGIRDAALGQSWHPRSPRVAGCPTCRVHRGRDNSGRVASSRVEVRGRRRGRARAWPARSR